MKFYAHSMHAFKLFSTISNAKPNCVIRLTRRLKWCLMLSAVTGICRLLNNWTRISNISISAGFHTLSMLMSTFSINSLPVLIFVDKVCFILLLGGPGDKANGR